MSGNTGTAGGTKGADPVPEKKETTAPDKSTALDKDSPLVTSETSDSKDAGTYNAPESD